MLETDNLPVLVQLDRLLREVDSGKLSVEFLTHKGKAKGVSVFGQKKLLYNRSHSDQNTNEKACEDILHRIVDAVKRGEREQLDFRVVVSNAKVSYVEWHSRQDKRFDKI